MDPSRFELAGHTLEKRVHCSKTLYLQLGEQALVYSQACCGLLACPGRYGRNLSLEALVFKWGILVGGDWQNWKVLRPSSCRCWFGDLFYLYFSLRVEEENLNQLSSCMNQAWATWTALFSLLPLPHHGLSARRGPGSHPAQQAFSVALTRLRGHLASAMSPVWMEIHLGDICNHEKGVF